MRLVSKIVAYEGTSPKSIYVSVPNGSPPITREMLESLAAEFDKLDRKVESANGRLDYQE